MGNNSLYYCLEVCVQQLEWIKHIICISTEKENGILLVSFIVIYHFPVVLTVQDFMLSGSPKVKDHNFTI